MVLVLEIVPRLPQEQANMISNRNRIKLVFRGLVENFINQGGKNNSKLT